MKQRPLGTATVTALGFGDVSLPIAAKRGIATTELERALHQALELDITLVESAPDDASERLCGDAVRALRLRDRVTTAFRVPLVAPRPGPPSRDALPDRLPAAYIQDRVETSLRASRLDALPLVLLPVRAAWRNSRAWPEVAGTCARLVREGKALQWGATVDDLERATELVDEPWLAALHVTFNLVDRSADPLLAAAAGKRAILARYPLAGAALAGTLGPGVKLSLHDDRNALDARALDAIAVTVAKLARFVRRQPPAAHASDAARAIAERADRPDDLEATTLAELALRYVIDRDAIVLPRLHRRDHLAEAIAAAGAPPLSPRLRDLVDEALAT